jgi:hypothetical protein
MGFQTDVDAKMDTVQLTADFVIDEETTDITVSITNNATIGDIGNSLGALARWATSVMVDNEIPKAKIRKILMKTVKDSIEDGMS